MAVEIHTALLLAGFLAAAPGNVDFDSLQCGIPPKHWTLVTPADSGQHLRVRYDATAPSRGNVLESSARGSEAPLAVFDPVVCHDGDLSVKFRIDSRASSGTAGIVWRYQNPGNYYLLDFSSSRSMITMYRIRDGMRQELRIRGARGGPSTLRHEVKSGEWHLARVNFRGNRIQVYLGNRRLFEAEDTGFTGTGKAGLVTSGSLVATFDDFRIDKKS